MGVLPRERGAYCAVALVGLRLVEQLRPPARIGFVAGLRPPLVVLVTALATGLARGVVALGDALHVRLPGCLAPLLRGPVLLGVVVLAHAGVFLTAPRDQDHRRMRGARHPAVAMCHSRVPP